MPVQPLPPPPPGPQGRRRDRIIAVVIIAIFASVVVGVLSVHGAGPPGCASQPTRAAGHLRAEGAVTLDTGMNIEDDNRFSSSAGAFSFEFDAGSVAFTLGATYRPGPIHDVVVELYASTGSDGSVMLFSTDLPANEGHCTVVITKDTTVGTEGSFTCRHFVAARLDQHGTMIPSVGPDTPTVELQGTFEITF
jgi:hypothetical protein